MLMKKWMTTEEAMAACLCHVNVIMPCFIFYHVCLTVVNL